MKSRCISNIILIISAFLLLGCSSIKYVPVESSTVVEYRDCTYFKVDTVYLPQEHYIYQVPELDTLFMYTSLSKATAYLDTNDMKLRGEIENLSKAKLETKERVIVKDSLVYQQVPVEVEVIKSKIPKWAWISLGLNVLMLLVLLLKLYIKLKP